MKFYLWKYFAKSTSFFIIFISIFNSNSMKIYAEESYLNDIQIDSSTKNQDNSSGFPSNPFEMVEMIRRANSMNNATNPSDAIDDALKQFDMIEDE